MRKLPKLLLAGICILIAVMPARAGLLLNFGFNDIVSSSISNPQYQTGNRLVYNAVFGDWNKSGFNATHAIQLSGATWGGAGDYAIMIYGDNTLTQKTAFAANDLGQTYYVSYDIGPTVYADAFQATQAGDTFLVQLLRGDNSVLAYNYVAPGAWSGVQTFSQAYFSYVGDGTGSLRIRLASGNTLTRFAGAIDNMAFWDSEPTPSAVPEPGQVAASLLLLAGLGGYVFLRRRKVAKAVVAA
jgi:MYXO-CTERM domain-containing protein